MVEASLRRTRRWRLAGAVAFLLPGLLGLAIALAAARGSDRLALAAVFTLVAVVPGIVLLALGARPIHKAPLYVALTRAPERITGVSIAYRAGLVGYHGRVVVHLRGGLPRAFLAPQGQAKPLAAWVQAVARGLDPRSGGT